MKSPFSKYLYIGFLLLGLYQACFSKDYIIIFSMLIRMSVYTCYCNLNYQKQFTDINGLTK